MMSAAKCIGLIDLHRSFLMQSRSVFPYLCKSAVGERGFSTAPLYASYRFPVTFVLSHPLTEEERVQHNALAHRINQNYVVRLRALVEASAGKRIDNNRPHANSVCLLQKLRNRFAHSSGRCNKEKSDDLKHRNELVELFGLNSDDYPETEFPLPIDAVLLPLTDRCKEYVKYRQEQMSGFVPVARVTDLADPGKLLVEVEDRVVALFHVDGEFYAIDDVCTHDGGPLAEGRLEGHEILCPRHGAKFDIRNGRALSMPATQDTITHEVKIEDGKVLVRLRD